MIKSFIEYIRICLQDLSVIEENMEDIGVNYLVIMYVCNIMIPIIAHA